MAGLDQMEQFNKGNIFPRTYEDTYIATKHIASRPLRIPDDLLLELKNKIDGSGLYFGDDSVLKEIITGIIKGNIILQGPPGTGKTSLAKIICDVFHVGYDEATAISDWTTYDTIGGLQPDTDDAGKEILSGRNGCVVDSILHCCNAVVQADYYEGEKQASWLILDELNRCEIDKVFGELFTAFGSDSLTDAKSVRLWYEKDKNKERIYIPNAYRIIGTMNNIDKNFVYDISQGLTRRFTFIEILPPAEGFYGGELGNAKKQAQKRVIGKVGGYGMDAMNEQIFASIDRNPAFIEAERDMQEFIRHIRYARPEDNSFLGLGLGTAQIVDVYETLYLSMFTWGYVKEMDKLEKGQVLEMVDMVLANRIIPQMDGFDHMKLSNFYAGICADKSFDGLKKSKRELGKYIY